GGVYAGPGVNNNVFDPAQAQFGINSINYTYTDINGCNASAAGTIFVSSCTAIDENTSSGFLIYPAITHDFVFIKSTALHQTNMIVKVLSAEGKICYTPFLNQSSEIDLRSCAPGMYTVVIETANKVFKQRVAKIE
ncbi:MAG: T9SS type A sorting domain-containing protein, partial [Ferruginibacter sp.]